MNFNFGLGQRSEASSHAGRLESLRTLGHRGVKADAGRRLVASLARPVNVVSESGLSPVEAQVLAKLSKPNWTSAQIAALQSQIQACPETESIGKKTALKVMYFRELDAWASQAAERENRAEAVSRIKKVVNNNDTSLNLSDLGLKEIPPLSGAYLSNLQSLALSKNELSTLPEGAFAGLGRLTSLALGHNQLKSIEPGTFAGLGGLTTLKLNNNSLKVLGAGTFERLGSLTSLELEHNRLESIEPGAFEGLGSLTLLDLSYNELAINPGTFAGLGSLIALRLDNNVLTELEPGTFEDLRSLTSLDLKFNRLTTIQPEQFPAGGQGGFVVELDHNRLNISTAERLTEWNRVHPVGPTFQFSVYDLLAAQLPQQSERLLPILGLWRTQNAHPFWPHLIQTNEAGAIHLATVLQRMYNECPRESNGKVDPELSKNISTILSTMERLHDIGDHAAVSRFLAVAETSVDTCIDKVKVGYLRMQVLSQIYAEGARETDKQSAEETLQKMDKVIDFVSDVTSCAVVWDRTDKKFVSLETMVQQANTEATKSQQDNPVRVPREQLSADQSEESTLAVGEFRQVLISAANANASSERYQAIRIGDEVEDILKMMNEMFTGLHRVDMRFEGCCTIGRDTDKLAAAITYVRGATSEA